MEKPSSNLQLAVSSLSAIIAMRALTSIAVPAGLVPKFAMVGEGISLAVSVFFLPLLWWRHKAGYVGSVAVGVWNFVNLIFPLQTLATRQLVGEAALFFFVGYPVFLLFSVLLIVFTYRASKEKA